MADRSELGLRAVIPLILVVFSLLTLAASLAIGNPLDQPLGPGLVPEILSLCILIGSAWESWISVNRLLQSRRAAAVSGQTTPSPSTSAPSNPPAFDVLFRGERRWLASAILLLLGVEVWHLAGYFIGSLCCVAALIWMDRRTRLIPAVVFTVVLVASMWFLFEKLLRVSLS